MSRNRIHPGERVLVCHGDRQARGWLVQADSTEVVVRLPSLTDPEAPGEVLERFPCPPPTGISNMTTCTSWVDHQGISIGYLDPTRSRTEAEARRFLSFSSNVLSAILGVIKGTRPKELDLEAQTRLSLRVRKLSLAVPLSKAEVWNDHGRLPMHEQAKRELEAEGMPKP